MDQDWPFEVETQCGGVFGISITGNWGIFYRCCQLNGELNDEWSNLNEDIWVRFNLFIFVILYIIFALPFLLHVLESFLYLLQFWKALKLL